MLNLVTKLMGIPKDGSSGKREMAMLVTIFTMALVLYSWPAFSEAARVDIIFWLLTGSLALIAAAFGMDSLINQAGFKFKSNKDAP